MRPSPPSAPSLDEATHACVRCGAPIGLDESLCERCNPLGLPAPAASQAHGTIFVAIVVSVAALALAAHFAVSGAGPYSGSVRSVQAEPPGLRVTLAVRNEGSRAGSSTCRVFDPGDPGIGSDATYVSSPQVPPGQTVTFSAEVTTLGPAVRSLATDCR